MINIIGDKGCAISIVSPYENIKMIYRAISFFQDILLNNCIFVIIKVKLLKNYCMHIFLYRKYICILFALKTSLDHAYVRFGGSTFENIYTKLFFPWQPNIGYVGL